jgi:DNA-binding transcriptional LysR family regulator
MNQIQAMRVFTRVAETQSFRRAAQQLDVSNALVTRSIAMLEAHLNTRLINRTTRNVSLTEAGHRYLQGCRRLLEELALIEAMVANGDDEPRGTLRIAVSASLSNGLTALIDAFRRRYAHVKLHLTLTEQPVDLIGDGFDAGIVHAGMAPANGVAGRALSSSAPVIVTSPEYLLAHPIPQTPDELTHLAFLSQPRASIGHAWLLRDARGAEHQVTLEPVYTVNSTPMLCAAVLAGMGVAILPERVVEQDLALGTLVRLLQDYAIDDRHTTVSVIYPDRQYMSTKTRAFVEFVLANYSDHQHDAQSDAGTIDADHFTALPQPVHDAQQVALAAIGDADADTAANARAARPAGSGQHASHPATPWPFFSGERLAG